VAFRKSFWGIISPQVADALALRHVVVLALDEGFHSVVLQCDCLALIPKINAHVRDRTTTCFIVADIKSLACNFSSVSFVHVSRSANVVAYVLAQSGEHSGAYVLARSGEHWAYSVFGCCIFLVA